MFLVYVSEIKVIMDDEEYGPMPDVVEEKEVKPLE